MPSVSPVLRSPFRFAGGKTWLIPRLRFWLLTARPSLLLEPFAGGASVSLAAIAEGLVPRVLLVELDDDIAAVWETALGGDAGVLAARVLRFSPSPETVSELLASVPHSTPERAFRALVHNRMSRGGVTAERSGILLRGENDRGLLSRWYPQTLARRILALGALPRERIEFCHGDGVAELARHADDSGVAAFVDPPYTTLDGNGPGRRLYRHHEVDHEQVFSRAAQMLGSPLLTYDATPVTRTLVLRSGLDARAVSVRTAHHRTTTELLIGRDLGWLRLARGPLRHASARRIPGRIDAPAQPVRLPGQMSANGAPGGFVPVTEAARQLGVGRRTVERLVASGVLERHRSEDGRSYITEVSLRAAIARRSTRQAQPTRADLSAALAGIERLVTEFREDRRALLQAIAEREEASLELAMTKAELERERARRRKAERALKRAGASTARE